MKNAANMLPLPIAIAPAADCVRAGKPLLAILLCGSVLCACGEMKPRTEAKVPAQESQDAATAAGAARDPSKDPAPGDPGWRSSSALGKARDSAVQLKEKIAKHEEEVSKQADEVFKK